MKIAEIDDLSPNLRVHGRDVKLLVCNDPNGALSSTPGFMAGVSVWPKGPGPDPHQHEAEELYVVLEGSGEVFQGGEKRKVKKGTVVFNPSNVKHGIVEVHEKLKLLWIICPGGAYPHKPDK